MNADAFLISHERRNNLGGLENIDWEWDGGDIAAISFSIMQRGELKRDGDLLFIGPFRLLIVGELDFGSGYFVMQDGWKARIKKNTYALFSKLDFVYRRLVYTAVVWGLAEYHEGVIPSWQDIYCLKRFVKK
jgi:hypothetical protein